MKRTLYIAFTIFICCTVLTGCWGQRELNELSIAFALGIDFVDGEYVVTTQIINPSELSPARQEGGGDQAPVATYVAKGQTLFEAFRRLTKVAPRKVYFSYVRIVVLGETLARRGILDSLDFLLRKNEFRTDFYLLVARGTRAEETLRVLTNFNPIPAEKVFSAIEKSESFWAATGKVTIDELITDVIQEGREPVLTGLRIESDQGNQGAQESVQTIEQQASLTLADMGAFRGNKFIGWLSETESKGFNYTQNNVFDTITTVPCPDKGKLAVKIRRSEATLRTKVTNGLPRGSISIQLEGNIGDVACDVDLSQEKTILALKRQTENKIRDVISESVHKAQKELHSDIFGFGEQLSRSDPHAWATLKNNWGDIFADMPIEIAVNVDIRASGSMTKSLEEIMRERR